MYTKYEPGFCRCDSLPPDEGCGYCEWWIATIRKEMEIHEVLYVEEA